jgi:hypothetical protein
MVDLTQMTYEELAQWQARQKGEFLILSEQEWQRRTRVEQHDLNIKLLEEQARIMKSGNRTIAIFTITATLLGSIVGAVVQATLPEMMKKITKSNHTTKHSTRYKTIDFGSSFRE